MTSLSVDTNTLRDVASRLQSVMKDTQRRSLELEAIEHRLDMKILAREQFQRRLAKVARAMDLEAQGVGARSRFLTFAAAKYESAEDAVRKRTPRASLRERLLHLADQIRRFFKQHPELALLCPGPIVLLWALGRHGGQQEPASGSAPTKPTNDKTTPTTATQKVDPKPVVVEKPTTPSGSGKLLDGNRAYHEDNPLRDFSGHCTWYVWGRALEKCGVRLTTINGADHWWKDGVPDGGLGYGGHVQSQIPRADSIAVWRYNGYGHVAYIEKVEGNYVWVSQANTDPPLPNAQHGSGYSGTEKMTISDLQRSYGTPVGYIYVN